VVLDLHGLADLAKLAGTVAGAVVGEQCAHADAVAGEELHGRVQEADGGFSFLIGQHLCEGHARVIVHGHVQSQEAWVLLLAAQPSIATQTYF